MFTHKMAARNDNVAQTNDTQKKWILMKETWLKGTKQVCGMTKSPPRHKETWWWKRCGRGGCQAKGMSESLVVVVCLF